MQPLVDAHLDRLLAAEERRWGELDVRLADGVRRLRDYVLAGGKRLRPRFCLWGYLGAGGDDLEGPVLDAAAALELLHAFALLHDDVMDGASTRRGRPAMHQLLAGEHREAQWRGEDRRFGEGLAVLLGDLAFAYADRLLSTGDPAARGVWDELRIELTMGQLLDVSLAASGAVDLVTAGRIAVFKSGRYTVERPLHLGAAVAGRLDELGAHYSAFGLPLGEAFQLRDDLLGVFGDASVTGKPVGDDLREGKPTVLLAYGHQLARGAGAALLRRAGDPDLSATDIEALRDVLISCGACTAVEHRIDDLLDQATQALDEAPLPEDVRAELHLLARSSTQRAA
jgi:geranylgeranyl diphosphate synthase, type I